MSSKLFINCKKAVHVCDKVQYKESGLIEKLGLRIHVIFCGPCKAHTKKNVRLTELLKQANIQNMPQDKKLSLQHLINDELAK